MAEQQTSQGTDQGNPDTGQTPSGDQTQQNQTNADKGEGQQGQTQASTQGQQTGWDGKPIRPEDHMRIVEERKRFKVKSSTLEEENQKMKEELEAFRREKMSDQEKVQADLQAKSSEAARLAEENKELNFLNSAYRAGAKDASYVAYLMQKESAKDAKLTPSQILEVLQKDHPQHFTTQGNGNDQAEGDGKDQQGKPVDTSGGGPGTPMTQAAGERTLKDAEEDLKKLTGTDVSRGPSYLRKKAALLQEITRMKAKAGAQQQ